MGIPVTATREVRIVDMHGTDLGGLPEVALGGDASALANPGPAAPDAMMPDTTIYVVVSGDSLWKISQKLYGTGQRWYSIYDMNIDLIGKTPGNIYAGMELTVPAE